MSNYIQAALCGADVGCAADPGACMHYDDGACHREGDACRFVDERPRDPMCPECPDDTPPMGTAIKLPAFAQEALTAEAALSG